MVNILIYYNHVDLILEVVIMSIMNSSLLRLNKVNQTKLMLELIIMQIILMFDYYILYV